MQTDDKWPSIWPIRVEPGGNVTLCLWGILAGPSQFEPILAAFPAGDVYASDPENTVEILDFLQAAHTNYPDGQISLVGASMGAMYIAFIIERYRAENPDDELAWLKIILIDPPNGAETMKELPSWAAPLMSFPASGRLVGSVITRWFLSPPKDEEIDVPDWAQTTDETATAYRELIKQTAMLNMAGFDGRQYQRWIAWMIRVGRDRSLRRACASLIGLDVVYIACVHRGNVTVAQPESWQWWRRWAQIQNVYLADAVHCGFMQQPNRFIAVFDRIYCR